MRLYAELPARRTRQVVADLALVAWVVAWVLAGQAVHAAVGELAAPGQSLESGGTSLQRGLSDAGESIAGVPVVGDDLQAPFESAAGAAGSVAQAGVDLQERVADVATVLGITTAAGPIVVVTIVWLVVRLRFVRRSGAARDVLAADGGYDLLALRALARQPTAALLAVSPDPAGAWRRGEEAVTERLVELELRAAGLRLKPSR